MTGGFILDQFVAAVHLLSAAAWFGALVYRAFFVDPRASRFFDGSSRYEHFSLELAHGMRTLVIAALLTCGLSGFVLMGLRWTPDDRWLGLLAGKAGLWTVALSLFVYISWVYWPARVFAAPTEWAAIRRQGLALALAMIGTACLGMVLGQIANALRTTVPITTG